MPSDLGSLLTTSPLGMKYVGTNNTPEMLWVDSLHLDCPKYDVFESTTLVARRQGRQHEAAIWRGGVNLPLGRRGQRHYPFREAMKHE